MTVTLEREVFEKGDTIIRQGNTGDQFYIIAEGRVGVYRSDENESDKNVATLKEGAYFGEKALLKEDTRQATCIAESKVTCLTLGRDDFIDMMGTFDDMLRNASDGKPADDAVVPVGDGSESSRAFPIENVKLSDLNIMATLGCGAFGRVKLCQLPKSDQYYALKCQSKKSIVDSGLQEHVLNEMKLMRKISHPYIAKLYLALQDSRFIYFILELLQGGELFTHLRNRGKLAEPAARFYAATVVYAFSHLHAKKIAYRDLKPENLVCYSCQLLQYCHY